MRPRITPARALSVAAGGWLASGYLPRSTTHRGPYVLGLRSEVIESDQVVVIFSGWRGQGVVASLPLADELRRTSHIVMAEYGEVGMDLPALFREIDAEVTGMTRAAKHRKVVIIGRSMGGSVGAEYAVHYMSAGHAIELPYLVACSAQGSRHSLTIPDWLLGALRYVRLPVGTSRLTYRMGKWLAERADYPREPGVALDRLKISAATIWAAPGESLAAQAQYLHGMNVTRLPLEHVLGGLVVCDHGICDPLVDTEAAWSEWRSAYPDALRRILPGQGHDMTANFPSRVAQVVEACFAGRVSGIPHLDHHEGLIGLQSGRTSRIPR
ncbi:hypothetical protein JNJ66_04500 [Candidatus Saccharibacteria bacterium]|nr:hypothetical protein [Candidatus Saccharibacteria bacterium]